MPSSSDISTLTPPAPSVGKPASRSGALVSLSLAMGLSSLSASIATIALPALTQAFAAPFQHVQWIVIAYLLAITAAIVSVGRLGDIVGRRKLLLAGLALFTVASVACAMAPTLWLLVAARGAQGLGAAVMMALTMAMISENVPKDRTGSAMGLLGTMSAIGTGLGPSLGGLLLAWAGWRAIFLINVPIGILALVMAARFLPADKMGARQAGQRFDIEGTLLLAATLAAFTLAMTVGKGQFGELNAVLLIAAFVGMCLFMAVEGRVSSPLIRLSVFADLEFGAGLATTAASMAAMMTTMIVGPFYLAVGLGLGAVTTGLIMSVGPAISMTGGVFAGRIVDAVGARPVVLVGLAAMACGSGLMCILPLVFGVAGYVGATFVLSSGYILFQAANNAAIMSDVAAGERGVVSGMLSLSRNLGLIAGASVMGALFGYAAGTVDLTTAAPAAIAAGMRLTFGAVAVLLITAFAAVLIARRLENPRARLETDRKTL